MFSSRNFIVLCFIFRSVFLFFKKSVYLFWAVLGLRCCVGFSRVAASKGYSLVATHGLLIVVASLVWGAQALDKQASVVAV